MSRAKLPKVIDPLLEPEQKELIARFALEMAPNTEIVHVRPMTRFGFSGAKLCLVHFDEARVGRPFVVKVDGIADITVEKTAIANLLVYFEDADVHYHVHGDLGAIAYPLQQSVTGDIETLEDVLRSPSRDARLRNALERVYERCCGRAHGASKVERRNLGKEYLRYHQSAATDEALTTALGPTYDYVPFDLFGTTIVDPRAVKTYLDATDRDITVAPIHGDLHGSNIVFDQDDHPHLIDFAWGDLSGHLMKDFVLMENSLRFFAFSRYFDVKLQAEINNVLLTESGHECILELTKGSPLEGEYACLASMIAVTRDAARVACGDGYFEEYLVAQFMMLYRLLQYPSYPFHTTLGALGALGRHIIATS